MGGLPLEFINIQPQKGGLPLEFINQRGSASKFHQHQPKNGGFVSRDNVCGSSGTCSLPRITSPLPDFQTLRLFHPLQYLKFFKNFQIEWITCDQKSKRALLIKQPSFCCFLMLHRWISYRSKKCYVTVSGTSYPSASSKVHTLSDLMVFRRFCLKLAGGNA